MNLMIHYNLNQQKQDHYLTDFPDSNFENNFDAAIVSIKIEKNHINFSYIYSNIDNKKQTFTL